MASLLSEDRMARTQGLDDTTRQDYEVEGTKTVYANSIVGIREDNGKVEPVDPSNIDGNPGYSKVGFTEQHSESNPSGSNEDTSAPGPREVRVHFGPLAVELDAETNLTGGEVGDEVYAASDHQFALSQTQDIDGDTTDESLPVLGTLRDTMGGAVDRAMIHLGSLA